MKTDIHCRPKRIPDSMDAWLDPDRTAVVCIDMHRDHLGTEPGTTCPAPRARRDRSAQSIPPSVP